MLARTSPGSPDNAWPYALAAVGDIACQPDATRPAPGNHEFYNEHGEKGDDGVGYFDCCNGLQLDPQTGQPVTAADPFGNDRRHRRRGPRQPLHRLRRQRAVPNLQAGQGAGTSFRGGQTTGSCPAAFGA